MVQNDESLVICRYLQAKSQRFRDQKVLLRIAQAIFRKFFGCGSNWKKLAVLLLQFYYAQKQQKKRLVLLKQFYKHGR